MKKYIANEINGCYETYKQVSVDAKLRYMPYAQAGWMQEKGNCFTMYSYSSRIFTAKFDDTGVSEISTCNADAEINCSRTTSQQVSAAMREIGLTDATIARLKKWLTSGSKHVTAVYAGRGQWVDACTGEVVV